ncbi:MAG: glycosyltransferase [Spirochaetia bacterium]|nr:glycosyltransferase [Spirochaetia bacterium]
MKKHIVFCANTAWNLYNFRLSLMESFVQAGWEVTGVAPADGYEKFLQNRDIGFVPVNISRSGTNPLADLCTLRQLRHAYRCLQPEVVCQFTIKPNIYGTLAASSLGIPAVNNISGLGTVFISRSPLTRLVLLLYRYSQRRAAHVFFQNNDDRREFIYHGLVEEHQTGLLPGSGIDLQKFSPQPLPDRQKGGFVFLMIARLLRDKGAGEFIQAAKALHGRYGRQVQCLTCRQYRQREPHLPFQ